MTCPKHNAIATHAENGQSRVAFTFPDGTVGPGNWNPETQQIEPVTGDTFTTTAALNRRLAGRDRVRFEFGRK